MWSALFHGEALPGRRSTASVSPVPCSPWSTNAHIGANPKPRLKVGSAPSLSECAVTSVASMSTITCPPSRRARRAGQRPAPRPHRAPGPRARAAADRGHRVIDVGGQGREQPRHRRVGGHRPEHRPAGRGPRPRRPGSHRPARPRSRHRAAPCPGHGPPGPPATAPAPPTGHGPDPRPGSPRRSSNAPDDETSDSRTGSRTRFGTAATLHLRSAFPLGDLETSQSKNPVQDRHFRALRAVLNPGDVKSRG